jgi:hypothetical protein
MVTEYTVTWVASSSPHGREMALKSIESKDEAIASAGWQTYSNMIAIKEDARTSTLPRSSYSCSAWRSRSASSPIASNT